MYGELRAQAARHEAITRDALARLEESEARERKHLRELENTRQRVAELEDTVTQLRERSAMTRSAPPSRLSTPRVPKPATTRRKAAEPGETPSLLDTIPVDRFVDAIIQTTCLQVTRCRCEHARLTWAAK